MLEANAACSIYSQYTLKSEWQRRFTGIASSSLKAIWKIVDWIECNEVHMISWIWSDHYTDAKETSSSSIIRLDTAWNTADRLYLILSKLNLIIRIIQTIQRWQLNSSGISRTICEGWCIFCVCLWRTTATHLVLEFKCFAASSWINPRSSAPRSVRQIESIA